MRRTKVDRVSLFLSCIALASAPVAATAHSGRHHAHHHATRVGWRSGGAHVIQCVAFARSNSGVDLPGNAANWWDNAAGVYARGEAPEVGSVLNFRANERMRLGHVAVVSDVVNSRTIRIDQSHWNSRGIARDVSVIDVSEANDWSAVRVELGRQGTYGSIYPTYGFIYARPDDGVRVARAAPRRHAVVLEVAETPSGRGIDLSTPGIVEDAPDRALR